MNKRSDGLWNGGPWEQPSRPVCALPRIPRPDPPVLRPRRRRSLWKRLLSVVLVVALLGGACVLGEKLIPEPGTDLVISWGGPWGDPPQIHEREEFYNEEELDRPPDLPAAPTGADVTVELERGEEKELSYAQIYERCVPSMVSIYTSGPHRVGAGTGVILTADGYILTNAHVLSGATYVEVTTFDNRFGEARLVGYDTREDLAVLKVELKGLTPARFGHSDDLRCGDSVAAIGDALGYRATITDGIISALDREVEMEGETMTLIQTSAAINFGSSGGALIDRFGRVVGITTLKIVADDASAESLGFAIPSARVKYVADRLIAGEEIIPAAFGIVVSTAPVEGGGILVLEVEEKSDCYAKGLRPNDILLSLNGEPLRTSEALLRAKQTRGPGDPVTMTVEREGHIFELEVTLTPLDQMEDD